MSFQLPVSLVGRPLNIVVVGAGGTGSALLTELFQMSFLLHSLSEGKTQLNVTVYDDDKVSFTNVGRQNFFACDVGLHKSTVLVSRFNAYGNTDWVAKEQKFTPDMLTKDTDVIITCTDSGRFRGQLGQHFAENEHASYLWLDFGNGEFDGQVILGQLGNRNKQLMNVYDYYPDLINMKDKPQDSCSHEDAIAKQSYGVNKTVALSGTTLLWQLIREGEIHHQGCFIDVKKGKTEPILLN